MAKRIIEKEGCWYLHYDDIKEEVYDAVISEVLGLLLFPHYQCTVGYASLYIQQKWDSSLLENKAKLDVYKCLYRIDKKLGTKPEIQLYWCCRYAVNINIIEVIDINKLYFIILFLSFSKILKLISNFKERKMVARYSEFYFNNVLNTSKQMISQKHHWKAKNSNSWSITLKIYFSNYQ